jgi:hypothetical protein
MAKRAKCTTTFSNHQHLYKSGSWLQAERWSRLQDVKATEETSCRHVRALLISDKRCIQCREPDCDPAPWYWERRAVGYLILMCDEFNKYISLVDFSFLERQQIAHQLYTGRHSQDALRSLPHHRRYPSCTGCLRAMAPTSGSQLHLHRPRWFRSCISDHGTGLCLLDTEWRKPQGPGIYSASG